MTRFVVAAGIVAGLGCAALAAPAMAQTKPTIAIIVKDTTSVYWQTVLAGARKAGQVCVTLLISTQPNRRQKDQHSREGCG